MGSSNEMEQVDLIDRQAAIDEIRKCRFVVDAIEKTIGLPSAQQEAKPPKWVAEDRYVKNRFAVFPRCPQCNADVTTGQCYCMICGQHIDWSEDDE